MEHVRTDNRDAVDARDNEENEPYAFRRAGIASRKKGDQRSSDCRTYDASQIESRA